MNRISSLRELRRSLPEIVACLLDVGLHYRVGGSNDNTVPSRCDWEVMVAHLEAVEAIPADLTTDDDIDLAGDIIEAIMVMPSPHAAALRWKLDYLLGVPGDRACTDAWSRSFIAQTVADYGRFLGEA